MRLKPFIKWAGGKTWLIDNTSVDFPDFSGTYIEPFLGGGAVFFYLKPRKAILSDVNCRLIETYRAIRDDWCKVFSELEFYQLNHSKEFYYLERGKERTSLYGRAAQFIYLNRTCFNGLYRENLKGEFNVPIGTSSTVVKSNDDFKSISSALAGAELFCRDFAESIDTAEKGDFIFLDPPYTVTHNENGFIKYNQKIFSWEDQIRLRDGVQGAVERGAYVMMTNANHHSVKELYKDLDRPTVLPRSSTISGLANGRGDYTEALYLFR